MRVHNILYRSSRSLVLLLRLDPALRRRLTDNRMLGLWRRNGSRGRPSEVRFARVVLGRRTTEPQVVNGRRSLVVEMGVVESSHGGRVRGLEDMVRGMVGRVWLVKGSGGRECWVVGSMEFAHPSGGYCALALEEVSVLRRA